MTATASMSVVRWLTHGKPIPRGWRVVDRVLDSHHNVHARLIEKTTPRKRKRRGKGRRKQ